MATRRASNTSIWVILGVVIPVTYVIFGFIWSIVQGQITDLRSAHDKAQEANRWSYATKDFVEGKLTGIKDEERTYRRMIDWKLGQKP